MNEKQFLYVRSIVKGITPRILVNIMNKFRMTKNSRHYHRVKKDGKLLKCTKRFSEALDCGEDSNNLFSNVEGVPHEFWLKISFLLFIRGEVSKSLVARLRALDEYLALFESSNGFRNERNISELIAVKREFSALGNLEKAKKICSICQSGLNKKARENDAYTNLVKDKKILILGPMFLESELLQQSINESDICILTNAFELPKELDFSKVSLAVYYNLYNEKRMYLDQSLRRLLPSVFSVFRMVRFKYQKKLIDDRKACEYKSDLEFISGAPQAIPLILHDVISRGCGYVKVAGANFYLSANPYPKNYSTKTDNIRYDIARHDLASNFLLAKYFYDKGECNFDRMGCQVMELSIEEYYKKIEGIYKE